MQQALIGHTGFVGSNLRAQSAFDAGFNSSNIGDIRGRHFDRIVCAGVSAVKWWANQNPEQDLAGIERLMAELGHVEADLFTLISTVDVYGRPIGVSEDALPERQGLHPYGLHRLQLEDFVAARFPNHRIVRLPALFGTGLKKNAIYDLIHQNRTEAINPDGRFQWYPLDRLSADLALVEQSDIPLVNFATEPVSMEDIRARFFPGASLGPAAPGAGLYDFRTLHAALFGGAGGYILDRPAVFSALERFLHAEISRTQGQPA
ncbi:MAG: hypothetical protein ABII76_13285 [Pseudomonadota bacterium]